MLFAAIDERLSQAGQASKEMMLLPRVRAVALHDYVDVARSVGIDPYEMLRDADIDPVLLSNPEIWLGARPVKRLLDRSAVLSGRDDFGILLADRRSFASLGPVSLVLKHQTTLRGVIEKLREHRLRLNDVSGLALNSSGDLSFVQWTIAAEFAGQQVETLLCAGGYRVLTEAMSRSWAPECAHFAFARPEHVQSYQRFFGCDLQFGAPFNGVSFKTADLDVSNPSGDAALAEHAERLLALVPTHDESVSACAKHALCFLLPSGRGSLSAVARNLGLSPRSLQRDLAEENTSFGAILRETRRDLASHYMRENTMAVAEVAHLLGYSSAGAFSRWFASQFDASPSQIRGSRKRIVHD